MESGPTSYRSWSRSRAFRLDEAAYGQAIAAHVVLTTAAREPLFARSDLARRVLDLVRAERTTWAACLMPDHLHWILLEPATMTDAVRRLKSVSTRGAWLSGHRRRLWQRSFSDRLIRNRRQLEAASVYLLLNPVRAKLAAVPADYPYLVLPSAERNPGPRSAEGYPVLP